MTDTLDLFGQARKLIKRPDAYAAMPGNGPTGKTCRTCDHLERTCRASRKVSKCHLLHFTRGKRTDISMHSPACRKYEEAKSA